MTILRFLILVEMACLCSSLSAANKYMRQGGSGDLSGSSWLNAIGGAYNYSNGDTIWIAGGTYGPLLWDGHSSITLKRATVNNPQCTGAAGWNISFDSTVIINCAAIVNGYGIRALDCDNFTMDGQVPGGFRMVMAIAPGDYNSGQIQPYQAIATVGNNQLFQYIDIAGVVVPTSDYGFTINPDSRPPNQGGYGRKSGFTMRYVRIDGCNTGMITDSMDYMLVEHCEISRCFGNVYNHDNVAFINYSLHGIWRYNYVHDFGSLGIFFSGTYPPGSDDWEVSGNIFKNNTGNGTCIYPDAGGGTPFQLGPNWRFFNNTFINIHQSIRTDSRWPAIYSSSVTGGAFTNNLVYQAPVQLGAMGHNRNWYNPTNAWSEVESARVNGTGVNPFVNLAGGDYHIITNVSATLPAGKGAVLAFTDMEGNANGAGGSYSIGALIPAGGAGSPGSLQMANAMVTVSESAGTVTITATRIGGTTGGVSVPWTTLDGTATAGVNYTTNSGTFSWGNGVATDQTANVTIANTAMIGNATFYVLLGTPTGGATVGQSSETITLTGTGVPPACILSGYGPWEAESACSIVAPFVRGTNGSTIFVYQPGESNDTNSAGKLIFTFTNSAGIYSPKITVNAPSTAANSFFVTTNGAPADGVSGIYDIPALTTGFESRGINLRGNSLDPNVPQYTNVTFQFAAGTNQIVIFGREPTQIDSLVLEPVVTAPPASVVVISTTLTNNFGFVASYQRVGSNVPITIGWSQPVTVTGAPTLTLSDGSVSTYSSVVNSTNSFWATTLGSGNTQRLDVVSINLNGGTIRTAGVDANLAVPTPGTAGSLSAQQLVIVDNIAPVATIRPPSTILTSTTDVTFELVPSDLNLGPTPSNLETSNITLSTTGTVTGTLSIGGTQVAPFIQVGSITGTGTFTITLGSGSFIDLAGNPSASAGPSATVTVSSGTILRSITTDAGVVTTLVP